MPKLFQITRPDEMATLKLDGKGCASMQYTVVNVSKRAIDARALLLSIPQTKPPNGPVEKGTIICRVPGPNEDMYLGYLPDVAFSKTGPAARVSLTEFYHTINYIVPDIISRCHL